MLKLKLLKASKDVRFLMRTLRMSDCAETNRLCPILLIHRVGFSWAFKLFTVALVDWLA